MAEPILLGTTEEWKTIPFAPNYEVSTFGQVRSWTIWGGGGLGRPLKHPRLLKPSLKKKGKGYYSLILVTPDGRKDFRVNRLVALTFISNPEGKSDVNHKDLNKRHNYVSNLEWMWPIENTRHAIENGARNGIGENNAQAKLTEKIVREIRLRLLGGEDGRVLAPEYGIHYSQMYRIKRGKNWKHVAV